MLLQQESICLVQEVSGVEFLVSLALHNLLFELGVMDRPLDKVSIHQSSFLNEVFFILVFKIFHLFVLAFDGMTDADESFQLRNFGLSIILIHSFKIFEEFIEDIFIFLD